MYYPERILLILLVPAEQTGKMIVIGVNLVLNKHTTNSGRKKRKHYISHFLLDKILCLW
jgi:hypothetical protein